MHRQLEKIREEYFDLVEQVVCCRGETDAETIKNLIENFGIYDVEINHDSIIDYDDSKICCVRIESYGKYLDYVYFNEWDKGNQNLDIYFDVYDHDEKCIILDGINILNLKDCYFEYIRQAENKLFAVTKAHCNSCDSVKLVRGFENAQNCMIKDIANDICNVFNQKNIEKYDVKNELSKMFCNSGHCEIGYYVITDCPQIGCYEILIPEECK